MTHLDYIINSNPNFNICIPSHNRPTGDTFKALEKTTLKNVYIYIDETDDIEEYKKLPYNIIIGPKRNIAEKRYDMVVHQQSLNAKFCWFIDDDYIKFQTKEMDAKYKDIGIASLFATCEQFIDIEKDWFCKIPAGNIGLGMFGAERKYVWSKPATISKRTNFAGCYGLNVGLMKKANINYDRNCPMGCGEDTELVCQFITKKLFGKTVNFVEAVYNKKVKSQAWDSNAHASKTTDTSIKHQEVYKYLIGKYPDIIYWDPKGSMGAVIHKTSIKYPSFFKPVEIKLFKFGIG